MICVEMSMRSKSIQNPKDRERKTGLH